MKRLDLNAICSLIVVFWPGRAANHAIWKNLANGKVGPVPRPREIKKGAVRAVCRPLEIPKP